MIPAIVHPAILTAWSPRTLSPILWLKSGAGNYQDSSLTTTGRNNDLIKGVADQTANGINATQSTTGHEVLRRFDTDWYWVGDTSSQLTCAFNSLYNFDYNTPFTIECMFRPNCSGAGPFALIERLAASPFNGYCLRFTKNGSNYNLLFMIIKNFNSNLLIQVQGSTALSNSTYYHCVITYTGSGLASGVTMYLNNVAETPTVVHDTLSGPITHTGGLSLFQTNASTLPCPCRLRFVRFYGSAFSSTTVTHLYNYSRVCHDNKPPFFPAAPATPIPMIVDSNYGNDVDDAHGWEMVFRLALAGYINLLGIITSTTINSAPGALQGIATEFGYSSVPIGAWQGSNFTESDNYATLVMDDYSISTTRSSYSSSATVYRTILAAAAANSVVIVSYGTKDSLASLLASSADGISSLTGVQLVTAKVLALYEMGGDYPTGAEYNLTESPTAAANLFNNWPTTVPIYMTGYTQGLTPACGGPLVRWTPRTTANPAALPNTLTAGRSTWAEQCVLNAVFGTTYVSVSGSNGFNSVNSSSGDNSWSSTPNDNQSYVVKAVSDDIIFQLVNDWLLKGMTQ